MNFSPTPISYLRLNLKSHHLKVLTIYSLLIFSLIMYFICLTDCLHFCVIQDKHNKKKERYCVLFVNRQTVLSFFNGWQQSHSIGMRAVVYEGCSFFFCRISTRIILKIHLPCAFSCRATIMTQAPTRRFGKAITLAGRTDDLFAWKVHVELTE